MAISVKHGVGGHVRRRKWVKLIIEVKQIVVINIIVVRHVEWL